MLKRTFIAVLLAVASPAACKEDQLQHESSTVHDGGGLHDGAVVGIDDAGMSRDSGRDSGHAHVMDGGEMSTPNEDYCAELSPFDAGEDACLACAKTNCCKFAGAARCLLVPNGACYEGVVPCAQKCFARSQNDASGIESSYSTIADCMNAECLVGVLGPTDPPFPENSNIAIDIVNCIIGKRFVSDDDSGVTFGPYTTDPSECAEVCFPGWKN